MPTRRRPAGINHAALEATREAVRRTPAGARGQLTTVTEWTAGSRALTRARQFELGTDEPAPLGGSDSAADPMELLMAALGACLAVGWVKQAEKRGIVLRRLRVEVQAPFDLRGYLELDPEMRPGLHELTYRVEVDTDAGAEDLDALRAAAERTSPLFDNILNRTPVTGSVSKLPKRRRPA